MPASKLSPEVQEQIVRLIKVGNTNEVAADAAGISRATFFSWMDRGKKVGKTNKPYRDFREAVEQARAEAEATLVARIAKAAQNGSWSAAAWLLERRAPERWGKLSDRNVDKKESQPISETDQVRDELANLRKRKGA